jgi:hypothetical protein
MEHLYAAARTIVVDRVTAQVVRAFDSARIPSVLLKGPVLARALYGDAARPYGDADLLVPPDRIPDAEHALAGLGFEGPPRAAFRGRWTPSGIEHSRRDGARVDLHATVHGATVGAEAVWAAIEPVTEPMELSGTSVRVPRPPAIAYLVASHAAHHGIETVKPLRDLELAVERLPEDAWRDALELADRVGGRAALAEGLRLTPAGAPLAERLGLDPAVEVDVVLGALSPPPSALGWQRVLSAHGAVPKVRALGRELVPSRDYMRTWAADPRLAGAGLAHAHGRRLLRLAAEIPAAFAVLREARREVRRRSSRAA